MKKTIRRTLVLSRDEEQFRLLQQNNPTIKMARVTMDVQLTASNDIILLVLPGWSREFFDIGELQCLREIIFLGKATRGWTVLYLTEEQVNTSIL